MTPHAGPTPPRAGGVPRSEVLGTLALAIDLGMGQPLGQGLGTCLVAVRFAAHLGLDREDLPRVYDLALLRHIGCSAYARQALLLLGDEVEFRSLSARVDRADPTEMLPLLVRHLLRVHGPHRLPAVVARVLKGGGAGFVEAVAGSCEVGQMLATRLGVGAESEADLAQVYERWDGKGMPNRLAGEQLSLPMRVVHIAEIADLYWRIGGREAAVEVVGRRAGGALDPALARRFNDVAGEVLGVLDHDNLWDEVQRAEPLAHRVIASADVDRALGVMADFADLKSPYTLGHSSGVAALVAAAARGYGMPPADVTALYRAGLVHDIGRVCVPAAVWVKKGPLSPGEWEQVRLHAYHGERVLAPAPSLAALGRVAGRHHERLDGSGYHAGVRGEQLSHAERLLAVADAYQAMTQERPHRPPLPAADAARVLRDAVRAGTLCGKAVNAVLEASGHRVRRRDVRWVAGLTDREVEVLRLVARGLPTGQVARSLGISVRTADHHIESIYAKTGITTRAAAALYALHHGLLAMDAGR